MSNQAGRKVNGMVSQLSDEAIIKQMKVVKKTLIKKIRHYLVIQLEGQKYCTL